MSGALGGIILPSEISWVNEFDWQPVEQSMTRSLGGRLFVQKRGIAKGRPIALAGLDEQEWITRAELAQLNALAEQGAVMTLLLNGNSYQVVFDYDAGAIVATPVVDYSDPGDDDFFTIMINLVTV